MKNLVARLLASSLLLTTAACAPPPSSGLPSPAPNPAPPIVGAREAGPAAAAAEPEPAPTAGAEVALPVPQPSPEQEPEPDLRTRPQKQWDHIAGATDETCRAELAKTSAKFQPIPDVTRPNAKGCGIPRGVLLSKGPTGIRYSPPVSIDCSLALKLAEVEGIIQEEAQNHLGGPIISIGTLGSFACRGVVGRLRGWTGGISEHSFGNAIDLSSFSPAKGRAAKVLGGYELGADVPSTKEGQFLRAVQRRVRREASMRVLGPDFDASHRDHLHLDAGSPWWR